MSKFPIPFGRYLLVDKIASGGMAEIFKAKLVGVEGFEKTVVIKRILPYWSQRREFITMLVDEAKVLVHLTHPNIVQVFELGRVGEVYFIAMEYVEGVDLRQLVAKLKSLDQIIPQEIALGIAIETLRGLHYAHERVLKDRKSLGIVHRDVSPQNILISFEGEVKLTDFGIAKAVTQSHETQTGVLKGKYAYMSPEQAMGQELDRRTDLFACGIVLHELLFDQRLFAGKNELETLDRVRQAEVPWPADQCKVLFPGVQDVLKKALSNRVDARFETAEAMAEALEKCLPQQRHLSPRQLAAFFAPLFKQEIQQQQKLDSQWAQPTQRQTQALMKFQDKTVSLVESLSAQAAYSEKNPKAWKAPLLGLLILLGGLGIFMGTNLMPGMNPKINSDSANTKIHRSNWVAVEDQKYPVSKISTEPKVVSMPKGELKIEVSPSQAKLSVAYPGFSREAQGKIFLEDIPLNSPVEVQAALKGYQPQKLKFKLNKNQKKISKALVLKKEIPKVGRLQINAVPWGRVFVGGFIRGSQTPVGRNGIPVGRHRVRVTNPSLGKSVHAIAVIRSGKTTRCHVDFEGLAGMSCR